jgi:hypothetical protein
MNDWVIQTYPAHLLSFPGYVGTVAHGTTASPAGSNHAYADGSVRWHPFNTFNLAAVEQKGSSTNQQLVPFRSKGRLNDGGYPPAWYVYLRKSAAGGGTHYKGWYGMARNGIGDGSLTWYYTP